MRERAARGIVAPTVVTLLLSFSLVPAAGQDEVDLDRATSLQVDDVALPDLWTAPGEATGLKIVGFVQGEMRPGVTLDIAEAPLWEALDRVAEAVRGEWKLCGSIVAFGPDAKPDVTPRHPPRWNEELIAFIEALTPEQHEHILSGRLLPLDSLTEVQAGRLRAGALNFPFALGENEEKGVPCVGIYFHPAIAVYGALDTQWGTPRLLMTGVDRVPERAWDLTVTPWEYVRDEEGYLAPAPRWQSDRTFTWDNEGDLTATPSGATGGR